MENSEPRTPLLRVVTPWVARWGTWAATASGPHSQGPQLPRTPLSWMLALSVLVQLGSPHRLFLAVRDTGREQL